MKRHVGILVVLIGLSVSGARLAQAQGANATPSVDASLTTAQESVPRLIQLSGTLKDAAARPVSGVASVTFAIYAEQDGGAALWSETQNVIADASGRYNALLGGATANGVPEELFGTGQSRWLGVAMAKQIEMPRVLLASVPYALKAADADTLGGLPASAYVTTQALAASNAHAAASDGGSATIVATAPGAPAPSAAAAPSFVTQATPTGGGTTNFIPLWTSSSALGNSILFQNASRIGVGTTTPVVTLDVNGDSIFRGSFQLVPQGTATASTGQLSHSYQWEASTYNSSTKAAVTTAFGFRATPQGNNTTSPTSSLDLYYGPGGGTLTDTGFSFAKNGLVTFATGQTFPGVAELGAPNNFETNQAFNEGLSATNPTSAISALASNTAGSAIGVNGQSNSTSGYGVVGTSPNVGVYGSSTGSSTLGVGEGHAGVWGDTGASGPGYQGVLGTADDNSAGLFLNNATYSTLVAANEGDGGAVEGEAAGGGTGVFGGNGTLSKDSIFVGSNVGVWGDVSGSSAYAVQGTADDTTAGNFLNHSDNYATLYLTNDSSATGPLFIAYGEVTGNYCEIETNGALTCSGGVAEIATVDGARKVTQYSIQSPENWSEDFGSATLANGTATVSLEATFAQTVNAGAGYHVYLTPNGDCKGLYVANKTASGFEVRELGGGTSSVAFDYKIVAKRVGYENVRLADVTARQAQIRSNAKRLHGGVAKPAGNIKSAPRPVSMTPTPGAAAPAISNTARQLAASASLRTAKPIN
jgi:hypothetical protein